MEETFQGLFDLLDHLSVSLTSLHCSSRPIEPEASKGHHEGEVATRLLVCHI